MSPLPASLARLASAVLFAASPALARPAVQEGEPIPFETGEVQVGGDLATASLPDGWAYYQTEDARYIVEEVYGNPEDPTVIGLMLPPTGDDGTESGWAIILSYEEEGHVDDADVADLDFDFILEEMQDGLRSSNEERRKAGYQTVELLGWAEPPHYDSAAKKLYWAKEVRFEGEDVNTLNYNVRILGREGVLVLNAVGTSDQLPVIHAGCTEILGRTHFNPGQRYEDYDPKTDKLAAYGIGGLIAGKVMAKAGLFKLAAVFFAKFWKLLLLAVVAGGGLIKRLFGGRSEPVAVLEAEGPAADGEGEA